MSAGTATDLVRDGTLEGRDPPAAEPAPPPSDPAARPHWIDVDRLERTFGRSARTGRRDRVPPPTSPAPARWRVAATVALTCGSVFVTLAIWFGNPVTLAPSLPRDEVIGQVVVAQRPTYVVSFSLPNDPGFPGVAFGSSSNATVGQDVVVRYDPAEPVNAAVVSWTTPHSRRNGVFGVVVVGTIWAVTVGYAALALQRRWRRLEELEQNTDGRHDEWAGTSYSA